MTRADTRARHRQAAHPDPALVPILPAVLALLDVPVDDRTWQALDPPQRRQRTLDALKRLLVRESQVQPVLVCENLHWIDTETQAFLERLVESLPTVRLLLLVNYRPEYHPPWGSLTSYVQLRLDPLPPTSTDELLQALLGDDPSLALLTPLLMARTAGNPFFLGGERADPGRDGPLGRRTGCVSSGAAAAPLHVPATVQAVLAARIDRLPPSEKRLLQTAAVIGTEVSLPLLQAIAELPEEALYRSLTHLQVAELLYETRLFPEHAYTFKHALTQEVAYSSLLLVQRRVLHARIVVALEALAGDRVAEHVERLAHHALRGRWAKAVAYARQGGRKPRHGQLTAKPRGTLSRRSAPRICRRRAPRASRPSISGSPCARRSNRLATWGACWCASARPRLWPRPSMIRIAWPESPSFCHAISPSWARMTRPSSPPSAPSRLLRPWGMVSCTRSRTSTSASLTSPRATIGGRSTAAGRP